MRHVDFAPLYRSTVGFDRLVNLLDGFATADTTQSYPPYNIERTGENAYAITMAVAGFGEVDLEIEAKENTLTVTGDKKADDADVEFLHRGIATRAFERRFQLADYVEVKSADLKNGLLRIELERELPEAMRPRKIDITGTKAAKQIEGKKAKQKG